jgi:hypothetical protein
LDDDGNEIPNVRMVNCGVAGPVYSGRIAGGTSILLEGRDKNTTMYSVEYGSEKYLGDIVKVYKKGQMVDVAIWVNMINI